MQKKKKTESETETCEKYYFAYVENYGADDADDDDDEDKKVVYEHEILLQRTVSLF